MGVLYITGGQQRTYTQTEEWRQYREGSHCARRYGNGQGRSLRGVRLATQRVPGR